VLIESLLFHAMRSRRQLLAGSLTGLSCLAAPAPIKITRFDIHKVTLRWRDMVFLEVHTDAGLTGLGEATLETRADMVEAGIRWLEPSFVGQDPSGIEDHWKRSYYGLSRWRNGPVALTALSAVDIALWDLEAKRLGVSVHRLLGAGAAPKLRSYFTHWSASLKNRTPEEFRELALSTRQSGWTAVKWTLPLRGTEPERIRRSVAEVDAVRKAVGFDLDIGLEAAETFSVRSALQFAKALEPYRVLFLEEPTLREDPAGLGELASKSPVPIASGEGLLSRWEFRQLLDAKGASIIQPDVLHVGGITELTKIAAHSEPYGVEVAPHQCSGPIAHVASLAAMSVCRNFLIQEWEAADDGVYTELTKGTYPIQKNGVIALSERPGLGLTVDFSEFKRRFPYKGIPRRAMIGN
jgi:galactonate dehydratase